jgi:hypothetical protein
METLSPQHPAIDISPQLYYQLVYTLTALLPPPLDDTPAGLRARNHAAIAKVAALLPVGSNEIDLAAHCIAARGQAEEMLRLIRLNAGDIGLILQLNAQYGSMVRTSLSVQGRLMRVQAVRQKREAIEGAAKEDAWTLHVTEQSMLRVVNPKVRPPETVRPDAAPGVARVEAARVGAARVGALAAGVDQRIQENVSENGMKSHGAAFETRLSEQSCNRGSKVSGKAGPGEILRRAMAKSRLDEQELTENGRESRGRAE